MAQNIEPRDLITALYKSILRREPDPGGMDHWLRILAQDGSIISVVRGFLESDEYLNILPPRCRTEFQMPPEIFTETLFRSILRRSCDPISLSGCVDRINSTFDPTSVLYMITESEEFKRISQGRFSKNPWDVTGGEASIRYDELCLLAQSHVSAGLPRGLDVVIPTFDSATRISQFCDVYDRLKIHPLYVVDARTTDDTLKILNRRGCRVITASAERPYVESLLFGLLPYFGGSWILRIDDDELPTARMLSWLTASIANLEEHYIGLPRRNVRLSSGEYISSVAADGSWEQDIQYRLFRPGHVMPSDGLHTPGFFLDNPRSAPSDCYFLHLDWITRDFEDRARKLSAYESHMAGISDLLRSRYLPEQMPENYYSDLPVEDEFVVEACEAIRKCAI